MSNEEYLEKEAKELGWSVEELKAHYAKEERIDKLLQELKKEDCRPYKS